MNYINASKEKTDILTMLLWENKKA